MTGGLRTIGVLGGMGPQATVLFMQRMISAVAADDDADHIPLLVDNNTQVPSRIKAIIEGTGEDPGPVLAAMAAGLEESGAAALAMPCNTAHFYATNIEAAASVPFLNMVTLSARRARQLAVNDVRVGILGSPALRVTGVFEQPLTDLGLVPTYWADDTELLSIIRDVKKHGPSKGAARRLSRVAQDMARFQADVIMICCSEFSLLADENSCQAPLFDTLDVLVDACVDFSMADLRSRSSPLPHPHKNGSDNHIINKTTNLPRKETA